MLARNRIMYHHHIVNSDDSETIKKIYIKQKEGTDKGDWFELVRNDFKFIGIEIIESEIRGIPKNVYKAKINKLIEKAAFEYMIKIKEGLTKLNKVKYNSLSLQGYLKSKLFSNKEINLLYALRARVHPAKTNFRKMYVQNLKCSWGCQADEDQKHIFSQCKVLDASYTNYENIFLSEKCQKEAIISFMQVEEKRKQLILLKVNESSF
jgi:hypothetical protein